MSRRCCPREEEEAGMAWGRGRWGCMAPGRKRHNQNEATSRAEQAGRQAGLGSCNCWGLLRIPGTVSSSTYNLCTNRWQPPFTPCFFSTILCFQTSADWLKALFIFAVLCSPLLYNLSLGSNNPWISPLLLKASPIHKQESSSSSQHTTIITCHSLFRTVYDRWLIIPSGRLDFVCFKTTLLDLLGRRIN